MNTFVWYFLATFYVSAGPQISCTLVAINRIRATVAGMHKDGSISRYLHERADTIGHMTSSGYLWRIFHCSLHPESGIRGWRGNCGPWLRPNPNPNLGAKVWSPYRQTVVNPVGPWLGFSISIATLNLNCYLINCFKIYGLICSPVHR